MTEPINPANYEKRAQQLLRQERYSDLRKWSSQMLAADPEHAQAIMHQGLARIEMGDWGGFPIMQEALARDPENPYYHYLIAHVALRDGRHKEALEYIQSAVALRPDYAFYQDVWGRTLTNKGAYAEAIPHYEKSLELDPDKPEPRMGIAYCYAQLGKGEEAIRYMEKARAMRPDDHFLHYMSGCIHYDLRHYAQARQVFTECILMRPNSKQTQYARLMSHHNGLTDFLYRPAAVRLMKKVIIAVSVLTFLVQFLTVGSVNATVDMVVTLLTRLSWALLLYLLLRSFLNMLFVFRLPKKERRIMLNWRDPRTLFLYGGMALSVGAFLACLFVHTRGTQLCFFATFNAFLLLSVVLAKNWLTKRTLLVVGGYTLFVAVLMLIVAPVSYPTLYALLAPFTAFVLLRTRVAFMNLGRKVIDMVERAPEEEYNY